MVVREAVAETLASVMTPLLVRSIVTTLPSSAEAEVGSLDMVAGYDLLRYVADGARIFSGPPSVDLLANLHDQIGGRQPFRPTKQVLTVASDHDVIAAQDAARRLIRALFKPTDCVRVITAVSELARNIYMYAGTGEVRLGVSEADRTITFQVVAADHGPGITRLEEILAGTYRSKSGLGRGLLGAKTLLEELDIQTGAQGTTIKGVKHARFADIMRAS